MFRVEWIYIKELYILSETRLFKILFIISKRNTHDKH